MCGILNLQLDERGNCRGFTLFCLQGCGMPPVYLRAWLVLNEVLSLWHCVLRVGEFFSMPPRKLSSVRLGETRDRETDA